MATPPTSRRRRLPFQPADHCWSCGAPVTPFQAVGAGGVCPRLECRAAEARRRRAEERAFEARRRTVARIRLEEEGVEPESASWSLTPFNPAGAVPLTPERRREFLDYLARTVREAVDGAKRRAPPPPRSDEGGDDGTADDDEDEDGNGDGRFPSPGPAEGEALTAGCAACRGWCCRRGGTHAFLTADRVGRLLRERPELEPGEVPALYASHLGEEHLEGGCVFQGRTGCRLPRELRSDRCNDYYCSDLLEARRRWRKGGRGGGPHHFVAVAPRGDRAEGVGTTETPEGL